METKLLTFICALIFSPPFFCFNSASWKVQLLCAQIKPQCCLIKMYATNCIWLTYMKNRSYSQLSWSIVCRAAFLQGMQMTKVIGASGTKKTEPVKRENTSKQTVLLHSHLLVLSPLAVSLGGLALQRSHLLLHLSFCGWQNWTGGYCRDQMKEDPLLLRSRNLGKVSLEKPRFCRTADNLAP